MLLRITEIYVFKKVGCKKGFKHPFKQHNNKDNSNNNDDNINNKGNIIVLTYQTSY